MFEPPKKPTDGLLPNALNIPMEELEQRLAEVPKGKTIGHSLFHRSPSSDGLQCTEKSRIRCKVCDSEG